MKFTKLNITLLLNKRINCVSSLQTTKKSSNQIKQAKQKKNKKYIYKNINQSELNSGSR